MAASPSVAAPDGSQLTPMVASVITLRSVSGIGPAAVFFLRTTIV